MTWRLFWRDFVPVTAKIPIWYTKKLEIEKKLYDARYNNIHFMHLPCNTLPENKKWIMGCQCSSCLEYTLKETQKCNLEWTKQYENWKYFDTTVPKAISSKWNSPFYWMTNNPDEFPMVGFDPLHGSDYELYEKWALRTGNKRYFSEDNI